MVLAARSRADVSVFPLPIPPIAALAVQYIADGARTLLGLGRGL